MIDKVFKLDFCDRLVKREFLAMVHTPIPVSLTWDSSLLHLFADILHTIVIVVKK
jgi:hypothetical protein